MPRDIDAAIGQRVLNGLGEDAEAAHVRERGGLIAVAVRLDEDEFDGPRSGDGLHHCSRTVTGRWRGRRRDRGRIDGGRHGCRRINYSRQHRS